VPVPVCIGVSVFSLMLTKCHLANDRLRSSVTVFSTLTMCCRGTGTGISKTCHGVAVPISHRSSATLALPHSTLFCFLIAHLQSILYHLHHLCLFCYFAAAVLLLLLLLLLPTTITSSRPCVLCPCVCVMRLVPPPVLVSTNSDLNSQTPTAPPPPPTPPHYVSVRV
jgi:hypothetical protein